MKSYVVVLILLAVVIFLPYYWWLCFSYFYLLFRYTLWYLVSSKFENLSEIVFFFVQFAFSFIIDEFFASKYNFQR